MDDDDNGDDDDECKLRIGKVPCEREKQILVHRVGRWLEWKDGISLSVYCASTYL